MHGEVGDVDIQPAEVEMEKLHKLLNRLSPVAANWDQIVVYSYQGFLGDATTNHRKIIPIRNPS